MSSVRSLAPLAALAMLQGVRAGFDASSSSMISVYWGQNSYGASSGDLEQQSLATYCANTDIDVIPMAFLYQITTGTGGQPVINFANSGNACTTFDGTELLDCPDIGADITTCQETYGKTILLSVGGATYIEGGFTSEDQAVSSANLIWATFGPEQDGSDALRPFGSASVDGFDFDFETSMQNTVPFANQLRSLMDADSSKTYYLSAAPQCVFPDAADNDMLNGAVSFDMIFVQFYNNYCGVQSYVDGSSTQNNFNFATWDNWATTTSLNPNVRVFVGVPADTTAAGSGYLPADQLAPVIEYCQGFSSFGGVMMWDASQAYANNGFISSVASTLGKAASKMIRGMKWY